VWRAEIDGRQLRFRLTGINNQNFLMRDEETGSWWQQITGEAVFGPLKGKRLVLVFHDELSFALWRRENPAGRVLVPQNDVPWEEFSKDWETSTAKLPVVTPVKAGDPLPPRELVVGVSFQGVDKAYPMTALQRQSPIIDTLGGIPIVLVLGEDGRSVRAFERRLDGRELSLFAKPDSTPLRLLDAETGSEWSFAGEAVSGPSAGKRLAKVYALKDYWFDWQIYHPKTEVYRLGER
jgi:hypothetical protein